MSILYPGRRRRLVTSIRCMLPMMIMVMIIVPIVLTPVAIVTDVSTEHPQKANMPNDRVRSNIDNDNDNDRTDTSNTSGNSNRY
jgi:hypothetical protein